jgi:secreted Zn-dependent insulinase-like peptidase
VLINREYRERKVMMGLLLIGVVTMVVGGIYRSVPEASWELFHKNSDDEIIDVGYKLPNGVKLLLIERKELRNIKMWVNVNVGHSDDPPEYPGVAHLMEHLIVHGEVGRMFARYNYRQNDNEDILSGFTNGYSTSFSGMPPMPGVLEDIEKSAAGRVITKLVDSLCNPVINKEIVAIEVEVLDTEDMLFRERKRDSATLVRGIYDMVSGIPYGHGDKKSLLGDVGNVEDLIIELKNFHKKNYVGEKSTVLLAGSNLEVLKLLGKLFERIPESEAGGSKKRTRM